MERSPLNNSERRLDSWKEIAAFFGRDERTVRRWEKENDLPVRRVPGGPKGRVYAYETELRQWLNTPLSPVSTPKPEPQVIPPQPDPWRGRLLSAATWVTAFALCAALAVAVLAYRKSHGFTVHAFVRNAPSGTLRDPRQPATHEAEDFYLKGRYYWNRRTAEDLNKAVDLFTQSIVQDPGYAPAYEGLADSYNLLREYSAMPPEEAYPRALAAAKKAVELDDHSADAHASLAFATFFGMWDVSTGEKEFRRAIELNPDNPVAHHWWANALICLNRLPEALTEIDLAEKLDPSSAAILADKGNILSIMGRQAEAIHLLKEMEVREPAFRSPHTYLAGAYYRSQDYPNYLSELRQDALLMHDTSALAVATAGQKGLAQGGPQAMFRAMLEVQKQLYSQHLLSPTALAQGYASSGDKAQAFQHLHEAYDRHDDLLLFAEILPEFAKLHDDSQYRDLVAKLNLPAR